MTKTQTLGQPADYDDWLKQSCCLESLIGQTLADQFRQQGVAELFCFHIMVLLTIIFVPQAVAQTHSLIMPQLVAPADGEMGGIDEV